MQRDYVVRVLQVGIDHIAIYVTQKAEWHAHNPVNLLDQKLMSENLVQNAWDFLHVKREGMLNR